MSETVPSDIAAAIEELDEASWATGRAETRETNQRHKKARTALDAVILAHLRGVDDMKAALELQTSGSA